MEMSEALTKAESLGAKVTFNAPLMTMQEVVGKYDTVQMGEIASRRVQTDLKASLTSRQDISFGSLWRGSLPCLTTPSFASWRILSSSANSMHPKNYRQVIIPESLFFSISFQLTGYLRATQLTGVGEWSERYHD